MKLRAWFCFLAFSVSLVYIQTLEKREYYQWEFDLKKGVRRKRKWTIDERLVLAPKFFGEFCNELLKLALINRQMYLNMFVENKISPWENIDSVAEFFITGSKVEQSKSEFFNVLFFSDGGNNDEDDD